MNAPPTPLRSRPLARVAAAGLALLLAAGCGDSTSRMAGTIELPPREPGQPGPKPQPGATRPQPAPAR